MPATGFTASEWAKIDALRPERFGLPRRRRDSVVLGTFNALKLGSASDASKRWQFLTEACRRFDLIAIQEVMDNLDGLRRLAGSLRGYRLLVSDTTGKFPGDPHGLTERLAYLYRPSRIRLDELASDITYDRTKVVNALFEDRELWRSFFADVEAARDAARAAGRRMPSAGSFVVPSFLTFMRQPHCGAFTIRGRNGAPDIPFLAVNAHLLYGKNASEREMEFDALLDWLIYRARQSDRMYHGSMILFGDLNLEFDDAGEKRREIDDRLRALNRGQLSAAAAAKVNFPLLSVHPDRQSLPQAEQLFRTTGRQSETYDQIGIFAGPDEEGLPAVPANATAGQGGPNGYDYGVFRFTDLFAAALHGSDLASLSKAQRNSLLSRANADVSDHVPAWMRVPIPGA